MTVFETNTFRVSRDMYYRGISTYRFYVKANIDGAPWEELPMNLYFRIINLKHWANASSLYSIVKCGISFNAPVQCRLCDVHNPSTCWLRMMPSIRFFVRCAFEDYFDRNSPVKKWKVIIAPDFSTWGSLFHLGHEVCYDLAVHHVYAALNVKKMNRIKAALMVKNNRGGLVPGDTFKNMLLGRKCLYEVTYRPTLAVYKAALLKFNQHIKNKQMDVAPYTINYTGMHSTGCYYVTTY